MSELVRKSHNVTVLIYHYVCPAKYRRAVIDPKVDEIIKEICLEIEKRYEIKFLEIGTDKDHVHFLIQSVPTYSPTKIIQMIKSLTACEVFKKAPEVKKQLWGGEFWSDGYYVSTVGQKGSEETIQKYVKEQGKEEEYQQLYGQQLKLFE
jgi:REP element-mobilizing transposase RayT